MRERALRGHSRGHSVERWWRYSSETPSRPARLAVVVAYAGLGFLTAPSSGCGEKVVEPFVVAPECISPQGGDPSAVPPGLATKRRGVSTLGTGVVVAARPVPPVSGGTLIALRDGRSLVVSDPDRDRIYVVRADSAPQTTTATTAATTTLPADPTATTPATAASLQAELTLSAGDEPGRLAEDGSGLVHVVLRGAGALVTIDPTVGQVVARRSVCPLPRGVAYDGASDRLYVACAGGDLLRIVPLAEEPDRVIHLDRDLRDVVVDGARLLVSRFRSAEVLVVDAEGHVAERIQPPSFSHSLVSQGERFAPAVAWNMKRAPDGGVMMVHQRGKKDPIRPTPGSYGGGDPCASIVHTGVTRVVPGKRPAAGPAMPSFVMPVDLALSPSGRSVAVVSAGEIPALSGQAASALFVTDSEAATMEWEGGCGQDGRHGPSRRSLCFPGISSDGTMSTCSPEGGVGGELIAVAFLDEQRVVVQRREPAELIFVDVRYPEQLVISQTFPLSTVAMADTGHTIFHANTGSGVACASCHPEGHEDGQTWDFLCQGPRRTQDIGGQLAGTEPFHWSGDLGDFTALMNDVFVNRMSGPSLSSEQLTAVRRWVDTVPLRPAVRPAGDQSVLRGKAVFEDATVGCAGCHNGPALTNNMSMAVGTGAPFQVPSLRGVGLRAPLMHDGCAPTLEARFGATSCSGGDAHGRTSHLDAAQIADLVAYLESL